MFDVFKVSIQYGAVNKIQAEVCLIVYMFLHSEQYTGNSGAWFFQILFFLVKHFIYCIFFKFFLNFCLLLFGDQLMFCKCHLA